MLTGFYLYNGVTFGLNGYDFGDNIAFYITAPTVKAKLMIDSGIQVDEDTSYPPTWEYFYISVGSGKVKASCFNVKEDGVLYKNTINKEFLGKLGAILRGMKSLCCDANRDDALEAMSNTFIPKKVIKYNIGDMGSVELEMKTIVKLDYSQDGVELHVEEDGTYDIKVNPVTNLHHHFKLDLSGFIEETEDDSWDFGGLGEDRPFSLADIIERNPDKSYVWMKDRKYHVVKEISQVEEICQKIWKHNGLVAFDTETTGLKVNVTSRQGIGDRLVGLIFSITPGEAWYFPIAHKKVKNICTPENERYIIERYFKPILENKRLLCHNGSFDWKVMYIYDICCNIVEDTYILFKVTLWNDHRNMELGLKKLTKAFLLRDSFELSDFVKGKFGSNDIKFWDLEEESVKYYGCPDTDNLIELWQYAMDNKLLEMYGAKKTYETEVQFSLVIAYQEFYGHCVDVNKLDDLVKGIKETKAKEYQAMVDIVGHDFNPRSNKDLPKVMFEELGYPVIELTDTGNPSCGKDTRKVLMKRTNPDGSPMYPFVHHLHNYLDSATLESNFTKNIDKFATSDGFMFSEVQQFLETGRVSVKNPNYQSYNDVVKKYIIPRTGYYAMDADYSSVEYRILASMAGQENLIKRFDDPDMDYHSYQASRMFSVPYELVSKQLRSQSKGVNFGLAYGMGDPSLGEHIFGKKTPENTMKAKKLRKLYFEGQENIEKFFADAKESGVRNGYSETFFGRRRYFDKRKKSKSKIEREAGNARIQGTAADIYKIAMVRLFTEIRKQGLVGKILISGFIHDECFLEVHKSIDPCKMLKTLQGCMMMPLKGWCPLYIGAGFGTNWYDAKKTEIPVQVQEQMVTTWGDTGLDWWNGDTEQLYYWEVGLINDYRRNRVISYLKDENNWGKVLSPVENTLAHEVLDEIKKGHHVEGVVDKNVTPNDDMIENLRIFSRAFGCEDLFEKANIKKPEHKETSENLKADLPQGQDLPTLSEVSPLEIIQMRIRTIGVFSNVTGEGKKLYFRYEDNDKLLMSLVFKEAKNNPGDVELIAVKPDGLYSTHMSVDIKIYPNILKMYLTRNNKPKKVG